MDIISREEFEELRKVYPCRDENTIRIRKNNMTTTLTYSDGGVWVDILYDSRVLSFTHTVYVESVDELEKFL